MTRAPRCGVISTTGPTAIVVVCSREAGHDGAHRCRLNNLTLRTVEWTR